MEKMEEDADKYFVDAEEEFNLNFWKQEASFKKRQRKQWKEDKIRRWHCKIRIRLERDILIWYLNDFYEFVVFSLWLL